MSEIPNNETNTPPNGDVQWAATADDTSASTAAWDAVFAAAAKTQTNTERFIRRILTGCEGNYVGGQHRFRDKEGARSKPVGRAFKTIDELLGHIRHVLKDRSTLDVTVTAGWERVTKPEVDRDGKPKELRELDNITSVKVLVVDIDTLLSHEDAEYATVEEALAAYKKAALKLGLPTPSMIINSGYGLHIYFVLTQSISKDEHAQINRRLTAGLRHAGLKLDAMGAEAMLRIPGTMNRKKLDAAVPVTLLEEDEQDIELSAIGAALSHLPASVGAEKVRKSAGPYTGGEVRLRDIDIISQHCAWVRNSLETGGVDNDDRLRVLAYKLATACKDTDDVAWDMVGCRSTLGNVDPDEFDNKLNTAKQDVEKNPKLAWVSCEAIAAAGAKQCQGCEHFGKGLRPLDFDKGPAVNAVTLNAAAPLVDCALPDIRGGKYTPDEAMQEISARFALVDTGGEVNVIHRNRYGEDVVLIKSGFSQWLSNVYVAVPQGEGKADKLELTPQWWLHNPSRPPIRSGVFKPHGPIDIDEYNFWRGFGVKPCHGNRKMRRFLRHLWSVVCKRDAKKFKYFIRWLAWAVQNPDKPPETAIVIKGEGEGSGKSTVSTVMLKLFGRHGMKVSSPEQIFGAHCDYLEHKSFLMVEEALFAGDPRIGDRVKDFITGPTVHINPKGRRAYEVTNILHAILTTNHDWAVPAGPNARRWFVLEVDEGKTFNRGYFDALYGDMEEGGYEELLNFLLSIKLPGWHPRNVHRTKELHEQQMLSASPIKQWLVDCAEQDIIQIWGSGGMKSDTRQLGKEVLTSDLFEGYCGWRKVGGGGRIESKIAFGKTLKKVLGPTAYNKNVPHGTKYSPGYFIPSADELLTKVRESIIGAQSSEDV